MPFRLRIPPEKEEILRKAVSSAGKSKTAFILEALDEKLGFSTNWKSRVQQTSGWMNHEEGNELRKTLQKFDEIHDGDWD